MLKGFLIVTFGCRVFPFENGWFEKLVIVGGNGEMLLKQIIHRYKRRTATLKSFGEIRSTTIFRRLVEQQICVSRIRPPCDMRAFRPQSACQVQEPLFLPRQGCSLPCDADFRECNFAFWSAGWFNRSNTIRRCGS